MAVETSRTAHPVTDTPRGAAMGTWALWLTVIVLAMLVAGLSTAALYLETGPEPWPPDEFQVPGRGPAWLAIALTTVATAGATYALWRIKTASRRLAALSLAWSSAALTGAVIALVASLAGAGFRWDEHAYTSAYWSLTGFVITFMGVGLIVLAAVLTQTVAGLVDEHRHLELTNAVIYLWFVLGASTVLLALVHYLPAAGEGG